MTIVAEREAPEAEHIEEGPPLTPEAYRYPLGEDSGGNVVALIAALSRAQARIESAVMDSTNPHYDSKYASLASVWHAAREPLTSEGFAVTQHPTTDGKRVSVTTLLLHESGGWLRSTATADARDTSPQSIGSVISYLRRYSLASVVGIAQEDDDANAGQPRRRVGRGDSEEQSENGNSRKRRRAPEEEKPEPTPRALLVDIKRHNDALPDGLSWIVGHGDQAREVDDLKAFVVEQWQRIAADHNAGKIIAGALAAAHRELERRGIETMPAAPAEEGRKPAAEEKPSPEKKAEKKAPAITAREHAAIVDALLETLKNRPDDRPLAIRIDNAVIPDAKGWFRGAYAEVKKNAALAAEASNAVAAALAAEEAAQEADEGAQGDAQDTNEGPAADDEAERTSEAQAAKPAPEKKAEPEPEQSTPQVELARRLGLPEPPPPPEGKKVTTAQLGRWWGIARRTGYTDGGAHLLILHEFGVRESTKNMTTSVYDAATAKAADPDACEFYNHAAEELAKLDQDELPL